MQISDPVASGKAADTCNGFQMRSYSHVEKYVNRNEQLNLNLE